MSSPLNRPHVTAAADLVRIVQAWGSDAKDLRDAAHEAAHAIRWKVSRAWTRDNIHSKAPRRPGHKIREEIIARAVEAEVCAHFGVAYDLNHWAMVCAMEQIKNERIAIPSLDWLIDAIKKQMDNAETKTTVAAVLSLKSPLKRQRKAAST